MFDNIFRINIIQNFRVIRFLYLNIFLQFNQLVRIHKILDLVPSSFIITNKNLLILIFRRNEFNLSFIYYKIVKGSLVYKKTKYLNRFKLLFSIIFYLFRTTIYSTGKIYRFYINILTSKLQALLLKFLVQKKIQVLFKIYIDIEVIELYQ